MALTIVLGRAFCGLINQNEMKPKKSGSFLVTLKLLVFTCKKFFCSLLTFLLQNGGHQKRDYSFMIHVQGHPASFCPVCALYFSALPALQESHTGPTFLFVCLFLFKGDKWARWYVYTDQNGLEWCEVQKKRTTPSEQENRWER